MVIQDKKIAIVGGGPGGLTLARLLQLKNANLKVYERDASEDIRVQGATLDLHQESGLKALQNASLMNEFKAHHRPDAGRLRILDKAGNIYLDEEFESNAFSNDRPEIDRQDLRDILLNSLKPGTVVWDSHFLSMETQNEGWLLHFKNGTSAYADLVIAAEGINSKIRSYITPIKPIYSGITLVEGSIYKGAENAPALWKLCNGGKLFAFGNNMSLILSTKGDGSLSFYTGCKVAENWLKQSGIDFNNKEQAFNWFKETYADWDIIWQELFASNALYLVPRVQYHYPLDQNWQSLSNLTILGDAAHAMPPYAGEGVNMAMQDALELAACLTSNDFAKPAQAIAHYEKQMLKRAAEVTQITLDSTAMLHGDSPIENMLAMMKGA